MSELAALIRAHQLCVVKKASIDGVRAATGGHSITLACASILTPEKTV